MSAVGTAIKTAVKVAIAAPIGWIAYSRWGVDHDLPLADAFATSTSTQRRSMRTAAAGALSYYADESGSGRPVVLIHSINAAANPREMQPLFDHYRGKRPVYAVDLPGFGFSDRSDRHYSPQLFADTIGEFLIHGVDEPADVIALSLSCEFTALAAAVNPDTVNSLVMISPTGVAVDHTAAGGPQLTITPFKARFSLGLKSLRQRVRPEQIYRVVANRFIAQPLFDLIVTHPSLRYFSPSSQSSGTGASDDLEYAYVSSHRPGARNVPLHFISRLLYTPDIADTYRSLAVPTLVLHGHARYTNFERLPEVVNANERWHSIGVDSAGDMVHQDEPDLTTTAIEEFWSTSAHIAH